MAYMGQPVPSTVTSISQIKVSDGKSVDVTVPAKTGTVAGNFYMLDGFFGVVLKTIKAVDNTAGETVALQLEACEYVTDQILAKENMDGDSINKVIIPQIPTRLEMLQNGKLAAATLPEPMASIAVHNGCQFVTGSDELGINPGVIMVTAKAADGKQAEIQAMYRAYNKAVAYLNQADRAEYIDLVIEKGGFPPAAKDALKLPKYHEAALPKESDVTDCLNWLKGKNLISESYSYKDIVLDLLGK